MSPRIGRWLAAGVLLVALAVAGVFGYRAWHGSNGPANRTVATQDLHADPAKGDGIETIAAALSEPRDVIEDIIEPYLIQKGFVQRTPRGRVLTPHAFRHLGFAEPRRDPSTQFGLFGGSDDPDA